MPKGKVKWFSAKKGYGFIREEEKDRDIFLHVTALESSKFSVLKENQVLKFDIKEDKENFKLLTLKKFNYRGVEQSGSSSGS